MCAVKVTLRDVTKITHNSPTLPPFSHITCHVLALPSESVTQLFGRYSECHFKQEAANFFFFFLWIINRVRLWPSVVFSDLKLYGL